MENLNPWQVYIVIGVVAFVAFVIALWLYNRREKRRKHAIDLAKLMNKWGLDWFAETYEEYAVGDYSGLAYKVREVLNAVRSDEMMVSKLLEVTEKVTTHVAEHDPQQAAKLLKILSATK